MNNGLTVENLLFTLPEVLRRDEQMQALAAGVAEVLAQRPAEVERLLIYPRIDSLPEELLDRLAYDFKVDWWDAEYTLAEKRQTLKDSWQVHRHLGTKAAVERAISAIYPETKVLEWFEYGGEPYCFKLEIDLTKTGFDKQRQKRVLDRVEYYKNLRSHLDGVYYFARAKPVIFVNPERFQPISLKLPFHFSNQPNDITLLNGRRRLDGSWKLDSTFRGVIMQRVGLYFRIANLGKDLVLLNGRRKLNGGWLLNQTIRGCSMLSVGFGNIRLSNHNQSRWQGMSFGGSFNNQTQTDSKSLALDSKFAEKAGAMAGEKFVKDTMWRLGGTFKLNGSKKLNAAIVKENI